jgi:predicted HicB family RNase H-like nuclease
MRGKNCPNLEYRGYYGTVEYSRTDGCLVGKVLGMSMNSITYEGATIDELRADFEAGVDSYLEGCKELGIKPRKAFCSSFGTVVEEVLESVH